VKSLPASLTLAAAAVIQALGQFAYFADAITISGQIFFPILFALMAIYLGFRTKDSERFGRTHVVITVLGFLLLILSAVGRIGTIFALYPQPIIYYAAFALLALTVALRIMAMPKKAKAEKAGKAPRRRRRVAGAGPTHLVATPKGEAAPAGTAAPADAEAPTGTGAPAEAPASDDAPAEPRREGDR
jgi:small-conductance mechanosensitive channel